MGKGLFDQAAETLESLTDLDRLEARGTLRIALKEAGLDAKNLTLPQLETIFERVMPQQLDLRAVGDSRSICSAVIKEVRTAGIARNDTAASSADEIFGRLGGR
jgi:hypothetical protein